MMFKNKAKIAGVAVVVLAGLGLYLKTTEAHEATLKIMTSPNPHADILRFVEHHFKDAPRMDIIEITGQMDPNQPLASGDIDANYFEHVPFLQEDQKHISTPLKVVATVHLEPLGLYSSRYHSVKTIPDGAKIGVPNNATNLARALLLLQANGLLQLKKGVNYMSITQNDIISNPHHYKIVPTDAALLARALPDFGAAIINGNFALEAGLNPARDSLLLEKAKDNPYANVLVVRANEVNDPRIKRLAEELSSPAVARYIQQTYKGAVIPVHATQ